jgi:AbrB family transcriptional regulator (stage V sporulation protein T)
MKTTGLVRRIDDLGRIVIPKEVRRVLRLREGDPMEIYIDREGEVILKKYSPVNELGDFAKEYADSLYEATGHIALIGDRDNIIAVSGASKRNFINKPIWNLAQKSIDENKILVCSQGEEIEEFDYCSQVAIPIMYAGDILGVIGLISKDNEVGFMEQKLVETAANFLAKQMED